MRFSLGTPLLVLLILSALSALGLWTIQPPPRADLVVWCFSDALARTYRDPLKLPGQSRPISLIDQYRQQTGRSVRVDLISGRAENVRLVSLFMSQGRDVPDLCEIEIGSIGQFLRPPVDDVGLLPLNDFLEQSGQMNRILAQRLTPWSKIDPRTGRRIYFGVPNDVHPMTITYRKDLFDQAGVDPTTAKTWPQFQDACLRYQQYWSEHGQPQRRAMGLRFSNASDILAMLLQRHINIVDAASHVHFADPRVALTLAFYAQLVAGDRAIGADIAPGILWAHELSQGNVGAMITADWRAGYLRQYAPDLAGKLRMMPLPRFDDTDAPTCTAGGTMMGIPRACKNPQEAWKLLEYLYLSPQGNAARLASGSNVLPPVPSLWDDPAYHRGDPFFGGQKVCELYADLARQIPLREVTPDTLQAEIALGLLLGRARDYVQSHGTSGLDDACRDWLQQAQTALQQRIDFGKAAS